ncbi:MAG: UDP-N-acetylglucosamine 2-epimerase (non-hydrolyzing) [Myxococcota bacterium]
MTVVVAVGTRPEAIKMAPVVTALRAVGVEVPIWSIGQHPEATATALSAFGLGIDRALPPVARGSSLSAMLSHLTAAVGRALSDDRPSAILVHGDTTGALAAALAAGYAEVPVGHVEAGLRTGDPRAPFPEELNRRLIDRLARVWFAPTEVARDRLLAEGCDPARIHVTGNPVVDALYQVREAVRDRPLASFPDLAGIAGRVVVVTAHRRENHGPGLAQIIDAAARIAARGATVVWPVHPSPQVEPVVRARLGGVPGVVLTGALSYPTFVRLLLEASVVWTDSGGVQEEAACLGRPTLVLRSVTERPEVLSTGVVTLVGTDADAVMAATIDRWASPPVPVPGAAPLGDGRAGERIAAEIRRWR